MSKLRAVVFDMDGVIFDSERLYVSCLRTLAQEYGMEDLDGLVRKVTGTNRTYTRQAYLEKYGQDFPYEEMTENASKLFFARCENGVLPIKTGVREILSWLKTSGLRVALASSTKESLVRKELTDAQLIGYFDVIVCGDHIERSKPAPDIYLSACRQLGVPAQEAIAVEDSFNGIRSAHAAGMRPVMVPDLIAPDSEMEEKAEKIFPSLVQVLSFLEHAAKEA